MASESNGAQSDINYFRTLPGSMFFFTVCFSLFLLKIIFYVAPSPPQNLRVTAVTADSITIKWLPPVEPNGQLNHYIIKYSSNNISGESLSKRDYCQNSMFFLSLIQFFFL